MTILFQRALGHATQVRLYHNYCRQVAQTSLSHASTENVDGVPSCSRAFVRLLIAGGRHDASLGLTWLASPSVSVLELFTSVGNTGPDKVWESVWLAPHWTHGTRT